jgi:hypothetical protein
MVITKRYIIIQKNCSPSKSLLVFCQFRVIVLASLLPFLLIVMTISQIPPPEKTMFVNEQNVMEIGPYVTKIDLTPLGVTAFDNKTIDRPVFTPGEGWVHYIMNPGWQGVLVVYETQGKLAKNVDIIVNFISTNDRSFVVPLTAELVLSGNRRIKVIIEKLIDQDCLKPEAGTLLNGQFLIDL